MALIYITSKNFETEVTKSKTPVIIDFYADWCGPCKLMAPIFEELAKDYAGKLKFLKLDTDAEQDLAQHYEIRSIPCLVVLNKGKEVDRIVGFMDKAILKKSIDALLKKAK